MHRRRWLITTWLCVTVLSMVGCEKGAVLRGGVPVAELTCASSMTLASLATCIRNATDNTQGRLLNGIPTGCLCCTPASSYNGRCIHIEQHLSFRSPSDWINPVRDTWPVTRL